MTTWPHEAHGHLLELQVDRGGRTSYRCLECGLRVTDPRDEELSVRPCGRAPGETSGA